MMLPFIHSFAHSPNVLSVYYSSATLPHGKESDMHPPPPESQYLVVDRLINRSLQYNDNYCFSHVRFCATPWTAARQAPPSLGFSRQEYWRGFPFPSPMRESEVAQLCSTLRDPMDCSLPGSSTHGIFQAKVLEWVAMNSNCQMINAESCTRESTHISTCQPEGFSWVLRGLTENKAPARSGQLWGGESHVFF